MLQCWILKMCYNMSLARRLRPCLHGVGITFVAGITLLEGTTHSFALYARLSVGLTHSTVKTHTGLQQKQIRRIVVRLIETINKPNLLVALDFLCCCRAGLGTDISSFGSRSLSANSKSNRIPDSRYLCLEIQLKVNHPLSHQVFSKKALHSCTSNLLYAKPL